MLVQTIFYAVGAYFLGSIAFGKIVARRIGQFDITERGSRNIGATNVARELGVKAGLLTLGLDVLKGFAPTLVFMLCSSEMGSGREIGISIVGLCALLGHQFSLFERFRGGKGVATALGVYLAVSPLACFVAALGFVAVVYKWDFISLGSMAAACVMPLLLTLLGKPLPLVVGALLAAFLIVIKHKDNIQRLINGGERRWRRKNATPESPEADPIPHRKRNG